MDFRRLINRKVQQGTQIFDKSKRSNVLADLASIEQRITLMVRTVEEVTAKLYDCLRTRHVVVREGELKDRDGKISKKMHKLKEYQLAQTVQEKVAELRHSTVEIDLLTSVLAAYQSSVDVLWFEQQRAEEDILSKIVAPVRMYADQLKHVIEKKEKLKRIVLDMDSAKNRLQTAVGSKETDRFDSLQVEVDSTSLRVDQMKEDLLADMYTLAAKEIDIASTYSVLITIQLDYHRTVMQSLEQTLPLVQRKIATYAHRPVFGCALDDHLRYTGRSIALVLEVCAAAIVEIGQEEDGIFRQSGNASRVRKLRAAFDSGDMVREHEEGTCAPLDDCQRDPHAIAATMKAYLRQLPDTLMTGEMFNEWMAVAQLSEESRLDGMRALLEQMPASNYANLRYLIKFLAYLTHFVSKTRMSAKNLALVIAPNILSDGRTEATNSMIGAHLIEAMILNADELFPGDVVFSSVHIKPLLNETGGFSAAQPFTPRTVHEEPKTPMTPASNSRPKARAPPPPQPLAQLGVPRVADCLLDATSDTEEVDGASLMSRSSMSLTSPTPPQRPPPPPPAHSKQMSDLSLISINDEELEWMTSPHSPVAARRRQPPPSSEESDDRPTLPVKPRFNDVTKF